jgi:hypothetical protein
VPYTIILIANLSADTNFDIIGEMWENSFIETQHGFQIHLWPHSVLDVV